ncbi:hypothetical protein [Ferrimonas marina]|uniref:Lipoprotein n=1 Tax=Ferrimonas marina TaxID=299255 RepID=A0A1M5U192_9GAMM|nr:hypothetical protein [Ferrimonas marina]SHH56724.1 hypothetical protein SAMN02745129_2363 [Ferrimonas marina]
MYRLYALLLATALLSGCTSTAESLEKIYGSPSDYASAEEWMAASYLTATYVDNYAVTYRIAGQPNQVFTSRKTAYERMRQLEDFRLFFQPCFDAAQRGETCDALTR